MRTVLRTILAHPRTSAAGLAALFGTAYAAFQHPQLLAQPEVWATILAALGLLAAADASAPQVFERVVQGEEVRWSKLLESPAWCLVHQRELMQMAWRSSGQPLEPEPECPACWQDRQPDAYGRNLATRL